MPGFFDDFDWGGAAIGFFGGPQAAHVYTKRKDERAKAAEEAALMKPALDAIDADPNMTPAEKAYARVNLPEFTKRHLERFGTQNVAEGSEVMTGLGGGQRQIYENDREREIDGVVYDGQGRPKYSGIVSKIIPGSEGSFYEQALPQIGPGRGVPQLGGPPPAAPQMGQQQGGDDVASLRAEAAEAIKAGADPAAVLQELQRMLGGAGRNAAPPMFPGPY